jgi:hypothetical protein
MTAVELLGARAPELDKRRDSYRQRSQDQLLSQRQLQAKEPRSATESKAATELRKVTDDVNAVYHSKWQLLEGYR